MAEITGYHTIRVEAHESTSFAQLISPHLRTLLFDLDRKAGRNNKIRQGLSVLRSFVGALKITVSDATVGLDIDPAKGIADSGILEDDLPKVIIAVAEAAEDKHTAICLCVDELQYLSKEELSALTMAMHSIQQRQLPVVLIGAGLPIIPALVGQSKSYAERLYSYPEVGALNAEEAARALQDPARAEDAQFNSDALDEIFRLTQGYPYFIQEWGYASWNLSQNSPITKDTVERATEFVVSRLDKDFFRVRFDRLTPSEKRFLRAIADIGAGSQKTSDIAERLGVKLQSIGPTRASLIHKGMIYAPEYGKLDFTVPLFDQFMRRAIPQL